MHCEHRSVHMDELSVCVSVCILMVDVNIVHVNYLARESLNICVYDFFT